MTAKRLKSGIMFFMILTVLAQPAYALSIRHHLYNMGRNLVTAVKAPVEGVVIKGPKNIAHTFEYEIHGREQIEDRGKLKYYFLAVWRMPGDELKGVIDGVTESVTAVGGFSKEFLSIFFSD